jgi:hypothetical protein
MPHLFADLIAPGLAAIILFAPERVLIHLGQPTIGAKARSGMRSRFLSPLTPFAFGLLIFSGHIGAAPIPH